MYDLSKFRRISTGEILLVKYIVKDAEPYGSYYAIDEDERDMFIEACSIDDPEVITVDTSGYSWIEHKIIPEQDIDLGVTIGENAYGKYTLESDPTYQMLELDMRITLLENGVDINDLFAD